MPLVDNIHYYGYVVIFLISTFFAKIDKNHLQKRKNELKF